MAHVRKGMTLIELLVVIAIIGMLVAILLPAVQSVRESARRTQCRNNLHQMGIAFQMYEHTHRSLPSGYIYYGLPNAPVLQPKNAGWIFDAPPPGAVFQPNGPGWSWVVLLMPFIEQQSFRAEIDFRHPVEHPKSLAARIKPLHYCMCPSDSEVGTFTVFSESNRDLGLAHTNSYVASYGSRGLINTDPDHSNGLFFRNSGIRYAEITDGLSHTLAIGERSSQLAKSPWAGVMTGGTIRTTPAAPVYTSVIELAPVMALARMGNSPLNGHYSEPYDFFSSHAGIVHFVFADGSVQALTSTTNLDVVHAFATRNGHEDVDDSL